MPFRFTKLRIPDVILAEYLIFQDDRGVFAETYEARSFAEAGIPQAFVQDNQSRSRRCILRGLHYQIQHPQGKLIRVVSGEVFDVAVDLRRHSPSFRQWLGVRLSADDHVQLWVPEGFAHGFYVLSDWAEVLYKTTDFYCPECQRTLLWNDPQLAIEWPLREGALPILSERDSQGVSLKEAETFDDWRPPLAGQKERPE
jgi:dTDP-4-dehydrorhamnose 3,5-epimerase